MLEVCSVALMLKCLKGFVYRPNKGMYRIVEYEKYGDMTRVDDSAGDMGANLPLLALLCTWGLSSPIVFTLTLLFQVQ